MAAGALPPKHDAIDPASILKLGRTRWFALASAVLMAFGFGGALYHVTVSDFAEHVPAPATPVIAEAVLDHSVSAQAVILDRSFKSRLFAERFLAGTAKRRISRGKHAMSLALPWRCAAPMAAPDGA
jgi:hypothetical protein